MATKTSNVQSVKRAVTILKSFSLDEPEMGVGKMSRRLGMPKSTVFRLLNTLVSEGLINQNPETGRYRLGMDILELASNVLAFSEVQKIARPLLRELADELKETVNLSVLDGTDMVNLEQFVSPGRLVMRVGWIGRRMPAHSVSSGKVILAFMPESKWETHLKGELERLTPNTLTSPKALMDSFRQIRGVGFAIALEELEEGLHAVSAPILNHMAEVVASVSVSGPSYRLSEAKLVEIAPKVVAAAENISKGIGYRGQG